MLFEILQLPRPAQIDVLAALEAREPGERDAALEDLALAEALAQQARRLLGAKPGRLAELERRRLSEIAERLDVVTSYPGVDPPRSVDVISNAGLAALVGQWLFNEVHAIWEGGTTIESPMAIGRRLLASDRHVDVIRRLQRLQAVTTGNPSDYAADRREETQLLEDDPSELLEPHELEQVESLSRLDKRRVAVGLWVCGALHSVAGTFTGGGTRDDGGPVVSLVTPALADVLATFAVEDRLWIGGPAADPAPRSTESEPAGFSSPETRARWVRATRFVACAAATSLLHIGSIQDQRLT